MQEKEKNNGLFFDSHNASGKFEKREFSFKWFFAISAAGIVSAGFMAIALFTVSDGRVRLAKLAESDNKISNIYNFIISKIGQRSDRLVLTTPRQRFENKRQVELSTEQKSGGKITLKSQKFDLLHISLAEIRPGHFRYPHFNALNLFSNSSLTDGSKNIDQIYANKINGEITFKKLDFDTKNLYLPLKDSVSEEEAKLLIRKIYPRFRNDSTHIDNILYNFATKSKCKTRLPGASSDSNKNIDSASNIVQAPSDSNIYSFDEDLIAWLPGQTIAEALRSAHYIDNFSLQAANKLTELLSKTTIAKGGIIRLGLDTDEDGNQTIVRVSVYNNGAYISSVAMNDSDEFVAAQEPESTDILKKSLFRKIPNIKINKNNNLTIYDSIYRAALSYGLSEETITQLLSIIATDVDLQSDTSEDDTVDIFYPSNQKGKANIIYVRAYINSKVHKYYRYKSIDGHIDYYNEKGASPKQFLLRKPLPNGHFSSPFGCRRHPILGYIRMHTGVDWAAPVHSIIIAAGDGVVTKMGPTPGYGNHTEIQHANGYMTSYSHQSGFAAGIRPGVHVHQGQVIGYIGSTGLSTGPHCHFEIVVNGLKVNPMRVHLPNSKKLKDRDLSLFEKKRHSIDTVLNKK